MTGFSQPERRALARSQTAQAHPDADLLNAFSEQTVTPREREQVLAHLAVCPACREVVSLAAPPVEAAVPDLARERSAWNWSVLRWGAVAASAVIVVIAVSLGTFQKSAPKMQVANQTAPLSVPAQQAQKAITEEVPASPGMKAPIVRYEKVAPAARAKQQVAARAELADTETKSKRENEAMAGATGGATIGGITNSMTAPAMQAKVLDSKKDAPAPIVADSRDHNLAASVRQMPPPPPSPGVPAKAPALPPMSETVEVTSQTPTVDTMQAKTSKEVVAENRENDKLQKARAGSAMAASRFQMNALDQRWQVTPEGYLLSSTDEGRNWVRQLPDQRFTHVRTVGNHVWACGPDGMLMHSIDGGMNWIRIIPIDQKLTLQGDITGIAFTDINHGTLETSKGERWTTGDAGKTWKKQ